MRPNLNKPPIRLVVTAYIIGTATLLFLGHACSSERGTYSYGEVMGVLVGGGVLALTFNVATIVLSRKLVERSVARTIALVSASVGILGAFALLAIALLVDACDRMPSFLPTTGH